MSNISDIDFIFNLLENLLNKQEENIVNYMNKFMTQEERNRHGDNICNYLLSSMGTLAEIRLRMMADGRKITSYASGFNSIDDMKKWVDDNVVDYDWCENISNAIHYMINDFKTYFLKIGTDETFEHEKELIKYFKSEWEKYYSELNKNI